MEIRSSGVNHFLKCASNTNNKLRIKVRVFQNTSFNEYLIFNLSIKQFKTSSYLRGVTQAAICHVSEFLFIDFLGVYSEKIVITKYQLVFEKNFRTPKGIAICHFQELWPVFQGKRAKVLMWTSHYHRLKNMTRTCSQ